MEVKNKTFAFEQAVSGLSPYIKDILYRLPQSVKSSAFEVRLRVNCPISIICANQTWFPDEMSQLHNTPRFAKKITKKEIDSSVISLCGYSMQSHEYELGLGYISLKGGHRAGVCGTAITNGGTVRTIRDISSINIRIAREIKGSADSIIDKILSKELCGLLIAGVPSSGKTTILRDVARQLSSGAAGKYLKVAVIDERGEIGAVWEGCPQNDLGPNCDVLNGYPKGEGIITAVRTLSPNVIICDEIGGEDEVRGMLSGVNSGVCIIASAHAYNFSQLIKKPQIEKLLKHNVFEKIVWLGSPDSPGDIKEVIEARGSENEISGDSNDNIMFVYDRGLHIGKNYPKGFNL